VTTARPALRALTRAALAAALLFVAAPGPVVAQTKPPLFEVLVSSVGPGAPEWPLYIGEELGFFARAGLTVTESTAGNAQNCVNALVTGDAPVAILASDIIIVSAARQLPIIYVAPIVTIPTYSLMVGPSIKTWNDLRGKVVLVTNKDDITAITLRKLAQAQKLDWLKDFNILTSGTSQLRTVALVSGNAQGAMLTQPFDVYAQRQGMHVLARGSDVLHDWISNGIAVNPNWAAAHRPELVRFLRVFRDSVAYAYAHPADAVAIMSRKMRLDPADVQIAYDEVFGRNGMSRDLVLNEKALRNVADGVVDIGTLQAAPPLSGIIDSSFVRDMRR
jgi:ABC-type nitrate/sulfonate/bicarbonate transport system substrate-binding protein